MSQPQSFFGPHGSKGRGLLVRFLAICFAHPEDAKLEPARFASCRMAPNEEVFVYFYR